MYIRDPAPSGVSPFGSCTQGRLTLMPWIKVYIIFVLRQEGFLASYIALLKQKVKLNCYNGPLSLFFYFLYHLFILKK